MILHNKPAIDNRESEAILRVLKSGWLAQGKEADKLEDEFCEYLGFKPGHAALVSSGSAALLVVLVSLGVKRGDEVIVPTYVCSALLNAIDLIGAKPVLTDVDPNDFNISYSDTLKKINSKTKAIIVPHIFGMPADVDKFTGLGVPVIEDCAQAIGSKINRKMVGTFGAASIFSFYASKVITTGYGGMVFSKDRKVIDNAKDYREFDCRKQYKSRFNFKISDINAAIGRIQLKKITAFLAKRKKISREYRKILPSELCWPPIVENREPNFYRFLVKTRLAPGLGDYFKGKGIKTIVPIQSGELLHRYLGMERRNFPVSEAIAKTTLSLPVYPELTDIELDKIKRALKSFLYKNNI